MDGFDNSENFGALISMCSSRGRKSLKNSYPYGREFQDMVDSLDDEGCSEEARQLTEKKRRLSFEQVKALERSFDADNKLEPERKLKLAQELGLQPRQVAIWFQNRRARWKAKQLEKDYDILKANYDALKLGFNNLEQEKAALTKELSNLKAKLGEENAQGSRDVKEEVPESVYVESQQSKIQGLCSNENQWGMSMSSLLEDRSSHGDSNGIPVEVSNGDSQLLSCPFDSFRINDLTSSSFSMIGWFQNPRKAPQHQFVKMEDQSLSSADEPCNFFSVDQAPTLNWYLPQQ